MTFHDIELPRKYSFGSSVSEIGNTAVLQLSGGQEQRIERWNGTRILANLGFGLRDYAELQELLVFKRARGHRAHTFRFWNPFDFSTGAGNSPSNTSTSEVSSSDVLLATGDGTTVAFQLVKRYTSGFETNVKTVTKPIEGTVKVAVAGVDLVLDTDFTVNYETGVITITGTAPSALEDVTAGFQYNEEVRFESDELAVKVDSFKRGEVVGGLRVISVLPYSVINDDFAFRGSSTPTFGADLELTSLHGALVNLDPQTSGLKLKLPPVAGYPRGGPHWKVRNLSATDTFDVTDSAGNVLFTAEVAGDSQRRDVFEIWLTLGTSTNEWVGLS